MDSKILSSQLEKKVDLTLQFELIRFEFPEITNPDELAHKISSTFDVNCQGSDISPFLDKVNLMSEDFELESRKTQFYGRSF